MLRQRIMAADYECPPPMVVRAAFDTQWPWQSYIMARLTYC